MPMGRGAEPLPASSPLPEGLCSRSSRRPSHELQCAGRRVPMSELVLFNSFDCVGRSGPRLSPPLSKLVKPALGLYVDALERAPSLHWIPMVAPVPSPSSHRWAQGVDATPRASLNGRRWNMGGTSILASSSFRGRRVRVDVRRGLPFCNISASASARSFAHAGRRGAFIG